MIGIRAWQISDRVFEVIRSEMPPVKPKRDRFLGLAPLADIGAKEPKEYDSNGFKVNPKPQKKRSTVTVSREKFLNVVCDALAQYQYLGPKQRTDLMVACRYAPLSIGRLCSMPFILLVGFCE
jgi:hypothetical protein